MPGRVGGPCTVTVPTTRSWCYYYFKKGTGLGIENTERVEIWVSTLKNLIIQLDAPLFSSPLFLLMCTGTPKSKR